MPNTPKLLDSNMECSTPIGTLRHFRFVYRNTYFVVVYSVLSSETTKKVQTDETCLTNAGAPIAPFNSCNITRYMKFCNETLTELAEN